MCRKLACCCHGQRVWIAVEQLGDLALLQFGHAHLLPSVTRNKAFQAKPLPRARLNQADATAHEIANAARLLRAPKGSDLKY